MRQHKTHPCAQCYKPHAPFFTEGRWLCAEHYGMSAHATQRRLERCNELAGLTDEDTQDE